MCVPPEKEVVMMLVVATITMEKKTIKRMYRYEMLVVMMVITVGLERLHRYD